MEKLARAGISELLPYKDIQNIKYPVMAKPVFGRGSRAAHKIENQKQMEGYLNLYGKDFGSVLVQPFVGGDEYTVSVIVNNLNEIIGIVPKKIILKRGITRAAVTEKNQLIENACREIVETLRPAGPFNVQLKLEQGRVFIFEINPRLSTTSVQTNEAFGNEIELYIKYFDSKEIKDPPTMKEGVSLFRYEENFFKK
jgi:carbamoyl-phosphate synthase large subunit